MKASVFFAVFGILTLSAACSHREPAPADEAGSFETAREPSSSAQGLRLFCEGANENEGAQAMLVLMGAEKSYAIQGSVARGGVAVARMTCMGRKDASYKPSSRQPMFDRYTVNRNRDCEFDDAIVSNQIVENRRGSFTLLSGCDRRDENCSTVYFCRETGN